MDRRERLTLACRTIGLLMLALWTVGWPEALDSFWQLVSSLEPAPHSYALWQILGPLPAGLALAFGAPRLALLAARDAEDVDDPAADLLGAGVLAAGLYALSVAGLLAAEGLLPAGRISAVAVLSLGPVGLLLVALAPLLGRAASRWAGAARGGRQAAEAGPSVALGLAALAAVLSGVARTGAALDGPGAMLPPAGEGLLLMLLGAATLRIAGVPAASLRGEGGLPTDEDGPVPSGDELLSASLALAFLVGWFGLLSALPAVAPVRGRGGSSLAWILAFFVFPIAGLPVIDLGGRIARLLAPRWRGDGSSEPARWGRTVRLHFRVGVCLLTLSALLAALWNTALKLHGADAAGIRPWGLLLCLIPIGVPALVLVGLPGVLRAQWGPLEEREQMAEERVAAAMRPWLCALALAFLLFSLPALARGPVWTSGPPLQCNPAVLGVALGLLLLAARRPLARFLSRQPPPTEEEEEEAEEGAQGEDS